MTDRHADPPNAPAVAVQRLAPLFVTGTDTGVGKTRVTRGLLRTLVDACVPVAPLKLIETGCVRDGPDLVPDDALALARAARLEHALPQIGPERFELPAAPSTAARREGRTLRFDALRLHVERAHALAPRVVLEGAGGALVPIGPDGTFADFAALLGARAVVVARDALGTLNHTLLTVEALTRRSVAVVAIVLNATGPVPPPLAHAEELRALLGHTPVLGPLPWQPDASDDECADALRAAGLGEAWWIANGWG